VHDALYKYICSLNIKLTAILELGTAAQNAVWHYKADFQLSSTLSSFFQELGDAAQDAGQLVHQPLQQLRRQPADLQRARQVLAAGQPQALRNGKNDGKMVKMVKNS
jgi:uncharacterized protein VirK/YbjX